MKFIKENSYEISKLFVNQIGISIFALSLSFAVNALSLSNIESARIFFGISLFSLGFYAVLLYYAAWEMGSKDKVKVDSGKPVAYVTVEKNGEKQTTSKRGCLLSLYALLPQLVFSFICTVLLILFFATGIEGFYQWSSSVNIVLRLSSSQYAGIFQLIFYSVRSTNEPLYFLLSSIGYIVLSVIPFISTVFGYTFGLNNKKIADLFTKNS